MIGMRAAALLLLLAAAPAAAYEEAPVADGGTLTGVVRFAGAVPALDPTPVNKNRDVCGAQKPSEVLVVGPAGGVKGSVILIEGITRGKQRTGDVVLDNDRCLFVAHVTALAVGDRGRVRNSDPILHNTHRFLGKPTILNLAVPNKGQLVDITRRLNRPGVVRVLCDAHPHMSAWIVVHDSPYLAVTDEQGAFGIDGVPPGTWRVTMWHEGFRPRGTDKDGRSLYDEPRTVTPEITIAPNGTAAIAFELK